MTHHAALARGWFDCSDSRDGAEQGAGRGDARFIEDSARMGRDAPADATLQRAEVLRAEMEGPQLNEEVEDTGRKERRSAWFAVLVELRYQFTCVPARRCCRVTDGPALD